jgi:hypothetical protein
LATSTQTHKTLIEMTGAGEASRDWDRLGNSAASAGRHFASTARGLGGLVATYAGAAATIFALQQAFSALSRAARAEQTIEGTRTLAREIGISGDKILATLKEIGKGQLTLAQVAETTNIQLAAGFNEDQILRLNTVALKASRALGRDFNDALTRLARGSAKLEPELLDELGIFTRIEPAVEKYAQSLNRSVSSLTQFERRQAFVNSVITEGERKFSVIDTSVPTTQQSFERLGATIVDLSTKFGQFLANVLQPFVDFLNNNVSNAMAGFLLLASLIAGKGVTLLKGSLEGVAKRYQNAGYIKAEKQLEERGLATNFRSSIGKQLEGSDFKGFLTKSDSNTKDIEKLIQKARDQNASIVELRSLHDKLSASLSSYNTKVAADRDKYKALGLGNVTGPLTQGDAKSIEKFRQLITDRKGLATDIGDLLKAQNTIQAVTSKAQLRVATTLDFANTFGLKDDKFGQALKQQIANAKAQKASFEELTKLRDNFSTLIKKNEGKLQDIIEGLGGKKSALNLKQNADSKLQYKFIENQINQQKSALSYFNAALSDADKIGRAQASIKGVLEGVNVQDKGLQSIIDSVVKKGASLEALRKVTTGLTSESARLRKEAGLIAKNLADKGINVGKVDPATLTGSFLAQFKEFQAKEGQAKAADDSVKKIKENMEALPPSIKRAADGAGILAQAFRGAAVAAGFIVSAISKILIFLSLAQLAVDVFAKLFGFENINILDFLATQIGKINEDFNKTRDTARGLLAGFAEGSGLVDQLKQVGLSLTQIDQALNEVSLKITKVFRDADLAVFEAPHPDSVGAEIQIPTARGNREGYIAGEIDRLLKEVQEKIDKEKDIKIKLSLVGQEKFLAQARKLADVFSTTDQFKQIGDLLKEGFVSKVGEGLSSGRIIKQGGEIKLVVNGIALSFAHAEKAIASMTSTTSMLTFSLDDVFKEFGDGILDAEKLSQKVGAVQNRLDAVLKAYRNLSEAQQKILNRLGFQEILSAEQQRVKTAVQLVGQLQKQEQVLKNIRTLYSKEIGLSDTAVESGLLSSTGKISQYQEETDLNRANFLAQQIEQGRAAESALNSLFTKDYDSLIKSRIDSGVSAQKALVGMYLQAYHSALQLQQTEEKRVITLNEQLNVLRAQNSVRSIQDDIQVAQSRDQNASRLAAQGTSFKQELFKIKELEIQIAIARSQGGAKRLEQLQKIKDLQFQIFEIQNKTNQLVLKLGFDKQIRELEGLKTILEEFPQLTSNNALIDLRSQIDSKKEQSELRQLEEEKKLLDRKEEFERAKIDAETKIALAQGGNVKLQIDLAELQFTRDKQLLQDSINENTRKLQAERQLLTLRKQETDAQFALQKQQADSQYAAVSAEIAAARTRVDFLVGQEGIFNKFLELLAKLLNEKFPDSPKFTPEKIERAAIVYASVNKSLDKAAELAGSINNEAIAGATKVQETQQKIYDEQIATIDKLLENSENLSDLQLQALQRQKELAIASARAAGLSVDLKLKEAGLSKELNTLNIDYRRKEIAGRETEISQAEKLRKKLDEIRKSDIGKTLLGFIDNINDAIADGVEKLSKSFFEDGKIDFAAGAKEWATTFLDNIRKNVTQNLIINPLQELVKEQLGGFVAQLFGVGKNDGSTPTSALWVRDVNSTINGVGSVGGDLFSKLGGWLFGSGPSGRLGSNGLPLMGGLESLASSPGIFDSIFSWLGFNSGGYVKGFAGGGLRDRIPSMLEPGEFVMRKDAVNAIGVNNLKQMNATGKGSAPNVSVNVRNEGTPKDAVQGDMKFDGEKWVLDILLKDIENNGPTRKAIRGLR